MLNNRIDILRLHDLKVNGYHKQCNKNNEYLYRKYDRHANVKCSFARLMMEKIHTKKAADAATKDCYRKESCLRCTPRLPLGLLLVYKKVYKTKQIDTYKVYSNDRLNSGQV